MNLIERDAMYEPRKELVAMMAAVEFPAERRIKDVRCKKCGHKAFRVYEGACGYLEAKCKVCKNVCTYDLSAMRRIRLLDRRVAS